MEEKSDSKRVVLTPFASMTLGIKWWKRCVALIFQKIIFVNTVGAVSGIIVSSLIYPADVIRRRLQVRGMNSVHKYYPTYIAHKRISPP